MHKHGKCGVTICERGIRLASTQLAGRSDKTPNMLPNGLSRTNEIRRRPSSFWTLFLLPLSFRTNFPLLLESRNWVVLPLLQRHQSQANVNDVQRRDISFFFVGWAEAGGRSGSLFSACLTRSNSLRPQSTRQRAAEDEPQNLNAVSAQMEGQRYVSGGNHKCAIQQGCGKVVGFGAAVCFLSFFFTVD